MAPQEPAPEPAPSVIDALREILADGVRLVRAEIGVVRAGGISTAKRAAFAVALLAAAAIAALLVVIFLLGAGAEGLGGLFHRAWLGWLIMAGLILVVAALLGGLGYLMLKKTIAEGRRVGATVKEDLEWVTRLPRQRENGS
jgi:cytochrome c biogenesis protein CcdA